MLSGGTLLVQHNGFAGDTLISGKGATMLIQNGGHASTTMVRSGGLMMVQNGGEADDTSVLSGAREVVLAGAIAGDTTISGGLLELAGGGSLGSGAVTFASSGGGILQLDNSVSFAGLVAGFGEPDVIDLRDVAFSSGTSLSYTSANPANTSGTLTVTDGAHTAHIMLIGQYAAAQFTLAADGAGGTLVGDPPVVSDASSATLAPVTHA